MTVAQQHDLRGRVLALLSRQTEPMSVPQIEVGLKNEQFWTADTFDVRDGVAELIAERNAEFVPGRRVRLVK